MQQRNATVKINAESEQTQKNLIHGFFYPCTVHLDNVKIPFYQQIHLLLNT